MNTPLVETDDHWDLPIIPLIDCILFLLFFYMLASNFKKPGEPKVEIPPMRPEEKTLPLVLPDSAAALDQVTEGDGRVIEITDAGELYFDQIPITSSELHARLREIALADAGSLIRVRAAAAVKYQDVVRLFDLFQFEGLHNVQLQTFRANTYTPNPPPGR